jgi:hypothetical protein
MTKQPTSPKPKIQLVASLTEGNVETLAGSVAGADAGLLRVSKVSSGAKTLQSISQTISDIPWGGWLQGGSQAEIEQMAKSGCDFLVFPATNTPLVTLQSDKVGKILEVEASLTEGLLRTVNGMPIDAVLVVGERKEDYFLTWHHLMLFQRLADLLTKPLLVSIPSNVGAGELQTLWEAGVDGVIVVGQPKDRMKELRQVIDKLAYPAPRRRERGEPRLSRIGGGVSVVPAEEEEEEEDE